MTEAVTEASPGNDLESPAANLPVEGQSPYAGAIWGTMSSEYEEQQAGSQARAASSSSSLSVSEPVLQRDQRLFWFGSDIYQSAGDSAKQSLTLWEEEYNGDSTSLGKEIRLVRPLGPRGDHSAIWLCQGPKQTQLVVKFFAQEFLWDMMDDQGKSAILNQKVTLAQAWEYNPSPQERALREAMAFLRLRPLQGSVLPLSYGFYYFHQLPTKDSDSARDRRLPMHPYLGHLMEYVEHGEMPLDGVNRMLGHKSASSNIPILLESVMQAILATHRLEVAHCDLSCRNMLLQWSQIEPGEDETPLRPRVVLFDFERAHFGLSQSVQQEESSEAELFQELGVDGTIPEVFHWFNEGVGRDLLIEYSTDLLPPKMRATNAADLASLPPLRLPVYNDDSPADAAARI